MNENKLLTNPTKIVLVSMNRDCEIVSRATYVFVGDVPRNVASALDGKSPAALAEYYGTNYRAKLAIDSKMGSDDNYHGSDDIGDIEALISGTRQTQVENVVAASGTTYVRDVFLYPEDRLSEVKEKFQMVSGVPSYRQHMYWYDDNVAKQPYIIYSDGIYPVDIYEKQKFKILGIGTDRYMYDSRDSIRVEALDTFILLGSLPNTIYVVDMNSFLTPVRSQLRTLSSNVYEFEMLYHGFVCKFWPQLSLECFYDYAFGERELYSKYPELAKESSTLAAIYRAEAEIINAGYRASTTKLSSGIVSAITQVLAYVQFTAQINHRNLIDAVFADASVPEIHGYLDAPTGKFLIRKKYVADQHEIVFPSANTMRSGVTFAIVHGNQHVFLSIGHSRYYVRASWTEEDEADFDTVIATIKKSVSALLTKINGFGSGVIAGELQLPAKTNIVYQSINACVFWRQVLSDASYKQFKAGLDKFMQSRITAVRNIAQTAKYEYMFRKGMYKFDTSSIDRIMTASSGSVLANQYAYATNPTIRQKWNQNYDGRIVRMSHRTTDIKFEAVNLHETEFSTLVRYTMWYILSASHSIAGAPKINSVRRLKKLREQDPELFNLKKHGTKKVYSVLCQGEHQPMIYTDEELVDMSARERAKVFEYWNFTRNRPAHYGCPNPKYPHLSFVVGAHPRGYCLPCCGKRESSIDGKRAQIFERCMADRKFAKQSSASRHIMSYGKSLDVGRLSRLPPLLLQLFGENMYMHGVSQHLPGVRGIGVMYALAACIGETAQVMMRSMVDFLSANRKIFVVLLNGMISESFVDVDALVDAATDVFLRGSTMPVVFARWNELIIELFYLIYGAGCVVFITADSGALECTTASPKSRRYAIIIRIGENYYPIFQVDPVVYFKTGEVEHRLFDKRTSASSVLADMLGTKISSAGTFDYESLRSREKIIAKHVNKQNQCYAVVIEWQSELIHHPVDYVHNTADGVTLVFDPPGRTGIKGKFAGIESVTAFIVERFGEHPMLAMHAGKPVALVYHEYFFYLDDSAAVTGSLVQFELKCDYRDVNSDILSRKRPAGLDSALIAKTLYENYQYQLVLMQFLATISSEKNAQLHDRLVELLSGDVRAKLPSIREQVRGIVSASPNPRVDFQSVQSVVSSYIRREITKHEMIARVSRLQYEFDKITLSRLAALSGADLLAETERVLGQLLVYKPGFAPKVFPNIFLVCGNAETCENGKLIVTKSISEYAELLARDLKNDIKMQFIWTWLLTNNIVDWFDFVRVPSERIVVYRLVDV